MVAFDAIMGHEKLAGQAPLPRRIDVGHCLWGLDHRTLCMTQQQALKHRLGAPSLAGNRYRQSENRAAARISLHRDASAMRKRDLPRQGEADAGAALLGGKEGHEDLFNAIGRDAGTIVADAK